jgi:hypothetical protein
MQTLHFVGTDVCDKLLNLSDLRTMPNPFFSRFCEKLNVLRLSPPSNLGWAEALLAGPQNIYR